MVTVPHVAAERRDAAGSEDGGEVSLTSCDGLGDVAATDSAALIVIVHASAPLQGPLQPPNVEPLPAVVVRVTTVPWL